MASLAKVPQFRIPALLAQTIKVWCDFLSKSGGEIFLIVAFLLTYTIHMHSCNVVYADTYTCIKRKKHLDECVCLCVCVYMCVTCINHMIESSQAGCVCV